MDSSGKLSGGGGVSVLAVIIGGGGGSGDASLEAHPVGTVRGAPRRRTGLGGGLASVRGGRRGREGAGKEHRTDRFRVRHLVSFRVVQ